MSHTPGPWEIDEDNWPMIYAPGSVDGASDAPDHGWICEVTARREENDNAALIAAAPDLYRVLTKLLAAAEQMRHGGYRDSLVATYDGWAHEARAAIAKAEDAHGR